MAAACLAALVAVYIAVACLAADASSDPDGIVLLSWASVAPFCRAGAGAGAGSRRR